MDQEPEVFGLLGVTEAWDVSRGGVIVAVVDTGVDSTNVHLTDAVLPGTDLLDGGDGRTDVSGHGTAIAGQIAAREVTGSGVVGLAPDSQILPVRVYESSTEESARQGRGPEPARTAEGIRWAADNGAVIIVVPQSTLSDVEELRSAVEYATSAGSLVVASAGNVASRDEDAGAVRFPAGYAQALSVTAVGTDGLPSDAVVHGTHVEVAAPGSQILTTFMGSGDCMLAGDTPATSFATGYAAAVAALVAAAHPEEAPADWEYRILVTALRPALSERTSTLGWGIIAPRDALNVINDGTMPGPTNPRFDPSPSAAPAFMARPAEEADTLGSLRRHVVLGLGGSVAAMTVMVFLVVRLRNRDQHQPRREP